MLKLARKRAVFAMFALAVVAAGCGGNAAESGVNVKTIATDLTYGVPESPNPAPPANTNPVPDDPLRVVELGEADPESAPRPPAIRPDPCPEALPTVFPEVAPTEIQGAPAEGTYTWRIDGSQTIPAIGKVRLPPTSDRTVSDVEEGGALTFTVEERELVFGSQYTVKSTYAFRRGGVDESAEGVNVDRTGLYLTKIERTHRSNPESNSEFSPSPPILMLPTPVTLGDSVNSSGVDPVSFEVLRQDGSVVRRERVDACGEPQDTFFVEGYRNFVSANGTTTRIKYNYGIATGMGGLPIVEHIESPCVDADDVCQKDAVTFKMDAHIGQLEPDD